MCSLAVLIGRGLDLGETNEETGKKAGEKRILVEVVRLSGCTGSPRLWRKKVNRQHKEAGMFPSEGTSEGNDNAELRGQVNLPHAALDASGACEA